MQKSSSIACKPLSVVEGNQDSSDFRPSLGLLATTVDIAHLSAALLSFLRNRRSIEHVGRIRSVYRITHLFVKPVGDKTVRTLDRRAFAFHYHFAKASSLVFAKHSCTRLKWLKVKTHSRRTRLLPFLPFAWVAAAAAFVAAAFVGVRVSRYLPWKVHSGN